MEVLSKAKIKIIRSLKSKKNREKEGLFIVEGDKIISELIEKYPEQIEWIAGTIKNQIFDRQFTIDEATIKELSSFKTPSNLLAIVRKPKVENQQSGRKIALDGIQDPGNMGTIIRTADWFGIHEIICSKETVDCFNPKVIQSTMGSIFRVNVRYTDLEEELKSHPHVFVATMEGEYFRQVDFPEDVIIVFGNEGNGISEKIIQLDLNQITIPRIGQAESLNVAMATGIVLAEVTK